MVRCASLTPLHGPVRVYKNMKDTRTKISISKKTNTNLNILCAKLDMKKVVFLDSLTKVPVRDLKELIAKKQKEE